MIPAAFEYDRASSVEEALGLLRTHGSDAKLIAGGQSLLPLMKLRLARPDRLIDIGRIEALKGIRVLDDGRRAVGSLTTYAELIASPEVPYGLFKDALPTIADVQVRNRGTIGGAIAHADPAADMPALLLALDAELVCRSAHRGERTIPATQFFQGPFTTALDPDELLIEIRLPGPSQHHASAYRMLEQPASGFAIAGVAVVIGQTGAAADDVFDDVRGAVTGVGDHPYRAGAVEAALVGTPIDGPSIASAVGAICEGVEVMSDIHADREYRAAMAAVMGQRALEGARARLT
ncbi:MAG: xanthine dehydrogenase family protein subunit M [Chloroflexi bacterium]|nr:xanthine dehydrogenase family protein subunit M [Chloroflexota bacterium]